MLPLLVLNSGGRRGEGVPWGPFVKGTNPIHEGSTLMTSLPPECLTFKYHHIAG